MMRPRFQNFTLFTFLLSAGLLLAIGSCNDQAETASKSNDQMVEKGKYLVQTMGCGDCHSPKIFTAQGPVEDSTRLLSGYPSVEPLMKIDTQYLHPGNWILAGPDLTSWVGPWGVSFSANLTPDPATGIGGWSDAIFIRTIRTGKYQGVSTGRNLLPPMPWQDLRKLSDNDLKDIFAYLQSLPPIHNRVPLPVPPNEVAMNPVK
ncbi:MAG: c-type cytochrome [Chitinophagaceae bacterium]